MATRKRNRAPEKRVETGVLTWGRAIGMDLHVVDSKAVYSQRAGRYIRSMTSESLPDIIGNFEHLSVWIELKAPGKRSTLKQHQRLFLLKKIRQHCFACCVDSVEMLEKLWIDYWDAPPTEQPRILANHLPKPPVKRRATKNKRGASDPAAPTKTVSAD